MKDYRMSFKELSELLSTILKVDIIEILRLFIVIVKDGSRLEERQTLLRTGCRCRRCQMCSEDIKRFLDGIRDSAMELNIALEEEKETNSQTQDILHAIELEQYNPRKGKKLIYTLRAVRKNRRLAKDTIERLTPIYEWSQDNQTVIKGMEKLLGTVRKVEKLQESRTYSQRTDILESEDLLKEER